MTNSQKDKSAKRQMQIDKLQNDKRQNVKYSKKTKIINEANFESSAGLQLFSAGVACTT